MIKAESTKNNEREAWVQLGLLDFTTLKGGQSLYHFLNNQLLATSKRQQSPKIECRFAIECDPLATYRNNYALQILKDKKASQQKSQIACEVFVTYKHFLTQLLNFQDRGTLRLSNPILGEMINQKQTLFLINAQQSEQKNYKLTVQVQVLEEILIKMTKNFEKDERNGTVYNENRVQAYSRNDIPELQVNFLSILSSIRNKDEFEKTNRNNQILWVANYPDSNTIKGSQVMPYVVVNSKLPSVGPDKNVLEISKGQDDVAGLYFDLDKNTIQTKEPAGFCEKLKPYQAKALTWLLFREGQIKDIGIDMVHAPLWTDKGAQLRLKQKLYICSKSNFVVWKRSVQKQCNGGILADQMGLGKTIMIIALILAHRPSQKCKTLIIAPLSVISQWQNQIKRFAPSLRVLTNQQTITQKKIRDNDIVIVNQFKIRTEFTKRNQSQYGSKETLIDYEWFRVVIDEAHNFKNSKTQMANAVFSLIAQYRWCLSGTPTQNKMGDLFSLCKFLKFSPWDRLSWWESQFPKKNTTNKANLIGLKQLLKGILLRRKKQSIDENGNKLLDLPKVEIKIHKVKLSEEAKLFYQVMDKKAQVSLLKIQKLSKCHNVGQIKKIQMAHLLSLLLKLRMICCHEFLIGYRTKFIKYEDFYNEYFKFLKKTKVMRPAKYNFFQYSLANPEEKSKMKQQTDDLEKVYDNWESTIKKIMEGYVEKCGICDSQLYNGIITPCLHMFCETCITKNIFSQWQKINQFILTIDKKKKLGSKALKVFKSRCPKCHDKLQLKQIFSLPRLNQFHRPLEQFVPNQKIQALMGYLKEIKHNQKAIVYTSFLGMMTLVCRTFDQHRVTYRTIKGGDSSLRRDQIIQEFNNNDRLKVLLITLKTGSVGLNMQVANKVFFMDPWWNPAIQEQAIGRVHRIGQTKQVEAVKFITDLTIQARIIKLSFLKKQMSDCILDVDDVANDKRFSNSRQQIKYLLAMQESFDDEQVPVSEPEDNDSEQDQLKVELNKQIKQILEQKRVKKEKEYEIRQRNESESEQIEDSARSWSFDSYYDK